MAALNPNQLVSCPYNPAHQVEHYRMHIHLQKCRKQYPDADKACCPLDSTHIVNKLELDRHILVCPKRELFDGQVYTMDNEHRPVANVEPTAEVECDEDWDNEVATSYKPDLSKKGAHVIIKARGVTPSERRKARMEGVQRYRPAQE